MRGLLLLSVVLGAGVWVQEAHATRHDVAAAWDSFRLAQADSPLPVPSVSGADEGTPATGDEPPGGEAGPQDDGEDFAPPEDLSLGEIPVIETIELTPETARQALDAYILVKDKYRDSDLDQFENLQDFVDMSADGKAFEADIKTAGFETVNAWNLAITTLTFAYSNAIDDQSGEILQQIAEIEQDTELAQDMKDRMIASLRAIIPSENNARIVSDMLADPVYAGRLKQLELEEE